MLPFLCCVRYSTLHRATERGSRDDKGAEGKRVKKMISVLYLNVVEYRIFFTVLTPTLSSGLQEKLGREQALTLPHIFKAAEYFPSKDIFYKRKVYRKVQAQLKLLFF